MKRLPFLLVRLSLMAALLNFAACDTMGGYNPKREMAKIEKEEARKKEQAKPHEDFNIFGAMLGGLLYLFFNGGGQALAGAYNGR